MKVRGNTGSGVSHLDADGETVARLRQALPDLPIVVSLDLHGNVSQRLVENCTATVASFQCVIDEPCLRSRAYSSALRYALDATAMP